MKCLIVIKWPRNKHLSPPSSLSLSSPFSPCFTRVFLESSVLADLFPVYFSFPFVPHDFRIFFFQRESHCKKESGSVVILASFSPVYLILHPFIYSSLSLSLSHPLSPKHILPIVIFISPQRNDIGNVSVYL